MYLNPVFQPEPTYVDGYEYDPSYGFGTDFLKRYTEHPATHAGCYACNQPKPIKKVDFPVQLVSMDTALRTIHNVKLSDFKRRKTLLVETAKRAYCEKSKKPKNLVLIDTLLHTLLLEKMYLHSSVGSYMTLVNFDPVVEEILMEMYKKCPWGKNVFVIDGLDLQNMPTCYILNKFGAEIKSIKLANFTRGHTTCKFIFALIAKFCTNVRTLHLSNVIGDCFSTFFPLAKYLWELKIDGNLSNVCVQQLMGRKLKSLTIKNNQNRIHGWFFAAPELQCLHLENCPNVIDSCLQHLRRDRLSHLILRNLGKIDTKYTNRWHAGAVSPSHDPLVYFSQNLKNVVYKSHNLTHISVGAECEPVKHRFLVKLLDACPKLTHIKFEECVHLSTDSFELFKYFLKLETLIMVNPFHLYDGKYLVSNTLKELVLANWRCSDRVYNLINKPNLEKLTILGSGPQFLYPFFDLQLNSHRKCKKPLTVCTEVFDGTARGHYYMPLVMCREYITQGLRRQMHAIHNLKFFEIYPHYTISTPLYLI